MALVLSNEMSAYQTADCCAIPRTTLNDTVKAIKNNKEMSIEPLMDHFHKTFTPKHEEDLANRLMPLSRQEFLRLAFQLAEKLKSSSTL